MAKLTLNKNPGKREIDGNFSKGELLRRIRELESSRLMEVAPQDIRTGKPFEGLFPVKPEVLEGVKRSVKVTGYDRTQPVILWREGDVLIDGHTRRIAAIEAEIPTIPALSVSLPDEETAVRYAYSLQFNRRNLTDADRFTILEGFLCNVAPREPGTIGGNVATLLSERLQGEGKTRERIAELLTVSPRTAQKYINVIERGTEALKKAVRRGNMTVNQADKSLKPEKPPTESRDVTAPGSPEPARKAGPDTDTTPTEKTLYSEDKGALRANQPTLTDIAIELIREYAGTGRGTQIDGIGDYAEALFRAGWIPEDEYRELRKTISRVKESGACQ